MSAPFSPLDIGAPLPLGRLPSGTSRRTTPVTSVANIGKAPPPKLSSALPASSKSARASDEDAVTERLSEAYAAKRMKEKRNTAAKPAEKKSLYRLDVAPGKMQRMSGVTSFKHEFKKLVRTHRSTFSNLAASKDGRKKRDFFIGIVEDKVKAKRVGSEWNRYDRMSLKRQVSDAHTRGDLLLQDKKMFHKIINTLKPE